MPQLAYCTNVHPSESFEELLLVVNRHAREVREACGVAALDVGLYLSNATSLRLHQDRAALEELQGSLVHAKLNCVTLNGFPYGGFHDAIVKERVYQPDWSQNERLEYSLRLAGIFAHLLPDGAKASISTVAGGFKANMQARDRVEACARNLARMAFRLHQIEAETGRQIILGLEPEPFTMLERGHQAFDFFREVLWRVGREYFVRSYGVNHERAEELLRRHIGLCYDACHQAVFFEDPRETFERARAEELTVAKIQVSSALEIRDRDGVHEVERFAEDRYLHQTVVKSASGQAAYLDLPEAIVAMRKMGRFEMARTHFHVPIFWDADAPLGSTQKDLRRTLKAALELQITDCLEIETYTWGVLPPEFRSEYGSGSDGIGAGIAEEFRWLKMEIEALNGKDGSHAL